jgi:hypothetical protein
MPGRCWIAGIAVIACTAFIGSSQAFAATQRYASPAGNGTACGSASPCSLETALNSGANGDEIIISPGDYGPVSVTLNLPSNGYAHGVHGQPAPRIHLAPGYFLNTAGPGARLSYVRIDGTSQPLDVNANTEADQVYVQATAGGACLVYGTMIDSVCSTASSGGEAIAGGVSASFTPILRNVTAEATGVGGVGIEYHASGGSGHIMLTAVNVIAHGTSADIIAQAILPDTVTINIDHSNFATQTPIGSGAAINATATQGQPPLFANAAAGDFSEAPGSPTINAGVTSAANGAFDVLGLSRTIGGATDIGAYEFDPFKGVTLGTRRAKVKKRKAKIKIGCPADAPPPCTGKLELTYAGGHKTAGSAVFSIAAGATANVKVKISKKALKKLNRKGKLATQAAAAATDGAGLSVTTSGAVKLKG